MILGYSAGPSAVWGWRSIVSGFSSVSPPPISAPSVGNLVVLPGSFRCCVLQDDETPGIFLIRNLIRIFLDSFLSVCLAYHCILEFSVSN